MTGIEMAIPNVPRSVEARPARLVILDGARGYLLIMMFVSHLTWLHLTPLAWFHHGQFSPVMDAEFFIPLSGFVCALSYGRVFRKAGFLACGRAVLKRLRWLYAYQIIVSLAVLCLLRAAWPSRLFAGAAPDFETSLGIQILQVMSFARQPDFLDILLVYMVLMLFIPVAQALLSANRTGLFFGILVGGWLVSRLGLDDRMLDLLYTHALDTRPYFSLAGHFNPLSYALPFYGGFYLGDRFRQEGLAGFRRNVLPVSETYFYLSAIVILFFAVAGRMPDAPRALYDPPRDRFSETALIGTVAIAYAVYFLLNRPVLPAILGGVRNILSMILTLPPLVMIGRNSLFFYSAHVVMVYLASYLIVVLGLQDDMPAIMGIQLAVIVGLVSLTPLKQRLLPGLP